LARQLTCKNANTDAYDGDCNNSSVKGGTALIRPVVHIGSSTIHDDVVLWLVQS